jgi:hypothetical protein
MAPEFTAPDNEKEVGSPLKYWQKMWSKINAINY